MLIFLANVLFLGCFLLIPCSAQDLTTSNGHIALISKATSMLHYRVWDDTGWFTEVEFQRSNENSKRVILMVPGKTESRCSSGSLSNDSIRVIKNMCGDENTLVVEWERGVAPLFELAQTTSEYANSVTKTLRILEQQKVLSISEIGIIGHSEGGLASMILCNDIKPRPSFLVLLAVPGVRGDQLTLMQNEELYKGINSKKNNDLLEDQLKRLLVESNEETIAITFEKALIQRYGNQVASPILHDIAVKFSSPWIHEFIKIDPTILIQHVNCPWLAIWGSDDIVVDAKTNITAYQKDITNSLKALGNVRIVDGYDHYFTRSSLLDSEMDLGISGLVHSWCDAKWRN